MQPDRYMHGTDRRQIILFPEAIDDYVSSTNPVRFIDAFVRILDMRSMGFTHSETKDTGRPPYDPHDLLSLYCYGYINRIRSSRKLERECLRNVEVMWLMRRLTPDFKTIADFRKDNAAVLKNVFRMLVSVCDDLSLFGRELIGIDGSKFRAFNSKNSCLTGKELEKRLKYIDERIEQYITDMDRCDGEESPGNVEEGKSGANDEDIPSSIQKLKARKEKYLRALSELNESGLKRISLTDSDSRMMKDKDGTNVCHNVQIAVDSANKLIADFDVVSDETDYGQLYSMSSRASETLNVERLNVVADKGYSNYTEIKKCADAGIIAYVPSHKIEIGHRKPVPMPGFYPEEFTYNRNENFYICPAGNRLDYRYTTNRSNGISFMAYSTDACSSCPLRTQCTSSPKGRIIRRRIEQDAVDEMAVRIAGSKQIMDRRKELCEHPFGTIKRAFGSDYLLLKGNEKVNGEIALTMTAYNMRRLFTILGVGRLMDWIENRHKPVTMHPEAVKNAVSA